jgi:hypothetical protein
MWRPGDPFAVVIDAAIDVHVGSGVAHISAIDARHGSNRSSHDTRAFRARNVRGLHAAS